MYLLAFIAAVVGLILGLIVCFVLQVLRYGPDDPNWQYDELLYEGVVILCAVGTVVVVLLNEASILSFVSQVWIAVLTLIGICPTCV